MLNRAPDKRSWNNSPEEVHHEVVEPEVQELWAGVDNTLIVVIEHAGGIVKNNAVELAGGDDDLYWVAEWVLGGDHGGDDEAEGTPCELVTLVGC